MRDNKYIDRFGIERETMRVDKEGKMADTKHPFTSESLSKDFCENQLEIITRVCGSIDEAVENLIDISDIASKELEKMQEVMWMSSNPPHINSEMEIKVAEFDEALSSKKLYRMKLLQRYGKRLMTYSGIHFNLSFDESRIIGDKNAFYLKLLKYSLSYSWLLVLLTAASPVFDASLEKDGAKGSKFSGYASMRSGDKGYWNQFVPVLDYTCIDKYCDGINEYINKGILFSEGELYLPVRIKSKGLNNLDTLRKDGVDHIELRMFDINPLEKDGICKEDLTFAYLMLLFFATKEDFNFDEEKQIKAIDYHKRAARYDLSGIKIDGVDIKDKAKQILIEMRKFFASDMDAVIVIDKQLHKLEDGNRYAEIIYEKHISDFHNKVLEDCLEKNNV